MNFFIGVVEDIHDPAEKNRVRVRIFGKHSEDTTLIPTHRLPWSNVMMPVTSGSVPGVGTSLGLVQGSWVVGMFVDPNQNDSVILGSLPSESTKRPENTGFQDPEGIHPKDNGNDTPLAARSTDFQGDPSFAHKRGLHIEKIATATPAKCNTIDRTIGRNFKNQSFDMLRPIDVIRPSYPNNKVYRTEGGHCKEYDDTEGFERISETHSPSGSYREIVSDGSSTTVVVGDNYHVIHKNNNVYIKGNCNLSIDGDLRTLVKGDYNLEVEGNFSQKLHQNSYTEVGLSEYKEVRFNTALNVGEDQTILIGKDRKDDVKGNVTFTVGKNYDIVVLESQTNTTAQNYSITSSKNAKFSCPEKIHINTPVARISGDCIAGGGGVSLITHTHTQNAGNDAGAGANTNPGNAGTGVGS